ncbi:flippase [Halomicroarcula limicola]|uniref:Flippase n=1 Tax=Haloarcula limicola TaxID=1429915 RepID=A0A8J8C5H9_9EURY|nr:flippase [Halomicroarcula limicola]MBV0925229.1 flippase [Halomicroarcula limicola]
MSSLIKSLVSILSGRLSQIIIGLVFTPLLVRIISQEQYGKYASILAGISVLMLLTKGGIFDASRKAVAEYSGEESDEILPIFCSIFLSLTYGIVSTVVVFISLQFDIVPDRYQPLLWILSPAILFENLHNAARGVLYGLKDEHIAEVLHVSRRLIFAATGLVFAFVGYGLLGVFFGYTLSFILTGTAGVMVLIQRGIELPPITKELLERGKDIATFGGYQVIGGLGAVLLYKTDILLVEHFKGSSATALYNSAIVPAEMIWFVPAVIQLAFLQHIAGLWADNEVEAINKDIRTGVKYGILSLSLFGIGLFALANPFLSVYFGQGYSEATPVLKILIIGTFFLGTTRVIIPALQATGWIRESQMITIGGLILNIIVNLVLIPKFGILGAATGTAISYIFIFAGNIIIWRQSPIAMVPPYLIAKIIFIQAVFGVVFLSLVSIINLSALFSLLVFPPLGFFLFLIFNIASGVIPIAEIKSQAERLSIL